jgi:hypothetical protein
LADDDDRGIGIKNGGFPVKNAKFSDLPRYGLDLRGAIAVGSPDKGDDALAIERCHHISIDGHGRP